MNEEATARLIENTKALTASVRGMNERIATLNTNYETLWKKLGRNKVYLALLGILMVAVLVLAGGLVHQTHKMNKAQKATDKIALENKANAVILQAAVIKLSETQISICEEGNDQATKQHQLWEGLIAIIGDSDPIIVNQFFTLLDETFPQQDCANIGE